MAWTGEVRCVVIAIILNFNHTCFRFINMRSLWCFIIKCTRCLIGATIKYRRGSSFNEKTNSGNLQVTTGCSFFATIIHCISVGFRLISFLSFFYPECTYVEILLLHSIYKPFTVVSVTFQIKLLRRTNWTQCPKEPPGGLCSIKVI